MENPNPSISAHFCFSIFLDTVITCVRNLHWFGATVLVSGYIATTLLLFFSSNGAPAAPDRLGPAHWIFDA
jgi:hypothetical protein